MNISKYPPISPFSLTSSLERIRKFIITYKNIPNTQSAVSNIKFNNFNIP